MKHRRLNPEELAADLRRTCAGIPAADLDAAADQVRAMGDAIKWALRVLSGWPHHMNLTKELRESITPAAPAATVKIESIQAKLDRLLELMQDSNLLARLDALKVGTDPSVLSALLGLMGAMQQSLPGAVPGGATSPLGKAYRAALAALAVLESKPDPDVHSALAGLKAAVDLHFCAPESAETPLGPAYRAMLAVLAKQKPHSPCGICSHAAVRCTCGRR